MKGMILAGGRGSRLYPITQVVSKHLVPVYDKPMIYYPMSVLMLAGIRDVLIITNPEYIDSYRDLFGDGSQLGMNISYEVQHEPRGIADAFIVGEEFIGNSPVALILGDNVFYGQGFGPLLIKAASLKDGAIIFGYYVNNPEDFGIIEFDRNGNVISLEEKPENPKSNYAIPGLYFYDNGVTDIAKKLEPSDRGEIEITELNKIYLEKGKLKVELLGRGFAWLDTGTPDSLANASDFVRVIQKREGLYVACIEEVAYNMGFIGKHQLLDLARNYRGAEYGKYLKSFLEKEGV